MSVSLREVCAESAATVRYYLLYIVLAAVIMGFGVGIGGLAGVVVMDDVQDGIESVSDKGEGSLSGVPFSVVGIFVNNLIAAGLMFVGAVVLLIPTVFGLGYNGFIVGVISVFAVDEVGLFWTIALLAPHGIIELPALWLAAAIPMHAWAQLVLAGTRGNEVDARELQRRIVYGMALVVVGLFVAAVIEVHLTGGVVLEHVIASQ